MQDARLEDECRAAHRGDGSWALADLVRMYSRGCARYFAVRGNWLAWAFAHPKVWQTCPSGRMGSGYQEINASNAAAVADLVRQAHAIFS